jgi:hypothetical protein
MPYSLQFAREADHLVFRVTGDNSVDSARGYLREVGSICERHGQHRVLIEEALDGPRLYSADVIAIIEEFAPIARRLFERLAYVDVNAGEAALNMQFAGMLANAFGVRVGVFTDVGAARRWLLAAQADPT